MNSSSTTPDSSLTSEPNGAGSITDLLAKLQSAPEKNRIPLIQDLAATGETGLTALRQFLLDRRDTLLNGLSDGSASVQLQPDLAAGKAYQVLITADSPDSAEFLQTHFPTGIVPLRSQVNLDYHPLQRLLAQQDFQAADQLTLQKLCELAGPAATQRKWVYFTDVEQLPVIDLQTINALWLVHSEGKFGFSVQRELWLSVGKNWEKLWAKIGWKDGINWTRYPQEFTWNLTAPRGHLPLSNQLRGVRAIASLLAHPAWTT
jgi:hypothetical protein